MTKGTMTEKLFPFYIVEVKCHGILLVVRILGFVRITSRSISLVLYFVHYLVRPLGDSQKSYRGSGTQRYLDF